MYYCYSVYRPPSSRKNKLSDAVFLDEFPDLLDVCNNLSVKCIIQRDMSVHFALKFKRIILKKHFKIYLFLNPVLPRCYVPLECSVIVRLLMNQRVSVLMHTLDWVMFRPKDDVSCSASVSRPSLLITSVLCVSCIGCERYCELCCVSAVLGVSCIVSCVVCKLCCVSCVVREQCCVCCMRAVLCVSCVVCELCCV